MEYDDQANPVRIYKKSGFFVKLREKKWKNNENKQ